MEKPSFVHFKLLKQYTIMTHTFYTNLLFALCFFSCTLHAQNNERYNELKKAGEALKRYMESAHPTPQLQKYSASPMIPMVQSIEANSLFFDNANMIVTETDQFPVQNESSIAINPKNPKNLIGSAVDYRSNSSTWVYYSFDGGKTWKNTNLGKPPKMTTSSNDPSVAFNNDGIGFLVYGAFGDRAKVSPENGVFFSKTTDGGLTWIKHIPVIQHLGDQTPDSSFEDKYYIWSDNSPISPYYKRLYIPWKRVINRDSSTQIVNVYSTDQGNTWSVPVPVSNRISGISEDTTFGQSFPLSVTGPLGQVYTVWNFGPKKSIGFSKSTDGGITFSNPEIIQTYNTFGIAKDLSEGPRHTLKGGVRAEAYPSLTCDIYSDKRKGYLYLVWAADSIPNIYFSRSTDEGITWSKAKIIHSDITNDQFWPWISIDPTNGDIAVMYLDSRDDKQNIITNCYISYSNDGGDTWLDRRASDAASDLRNNPFQNNVFAGDYSGCAFYDGIIYPSWVDMRNAAITKIDNDVYTSIINTRNPQPPDPFWARPSSIDTTLITLYWEAPKARSFGQSLNGECTYILFRNNQFLASLPSGQFTYRDTSVIAYRLYKYSIRAIIGQDTSAERLVSCTAGGSKLPQAPKILSFTPKASPHSIDLSISIPAFRADTITPFVNPHSLLIYRDGLKIKEFPLSILDTGKVLTIVDSLNEKGWYRYYCTIKDASASKLESAKSFDILAYGGTVLSNHSETFDETVLPKYHIGGTFKSNAVFAHSKPFSLDESPDGLYSRNEKDTFMIFPIRTMNKSTYALSFWHAAIVDIEDSAIVEYSSDWGKQWNQLSTYNRNNYTPWNDGEQNDADWKPETLLFNAESDTALIRFRFKSNGSIQDAGWSIDDILFSSSTDIKRQDDKQSDFIMYPNPAKESIIISNIFNTYIDKVICYDILGKEVQQINVNNRMQDMIIMDISSLSNGVYSLAIIQKGSMLSVKQLVISR